MLGMVRLGTLVQLVQLVSATKKNFFLGGPGTPLGDHYHYHYTIGHLPPPLTTLPRG